jgi:hypothetical protein
MNDDFILWSFPLIVLTVFLLATVSKPEMPHLNIELPAMNHPVQDASVLPEQILAFQ